MTVTVQTPLNTYVANGVTTAFSFSFLALDANDLVVQTTDTSGVTTTKALTADYTVSGIGVPSGGTVTFLAAPAASVTVAIFRNSDLQRSTDYQDNGDLLADTVNVDLDRLWLTLQELVTGVKGVDGAIRVPPGETVAALPGAASRLDKLLGFNGSGAPVVSSFTMTQVASAIAAIYAAAAGPLDALSFLQAGVGALSRSAQAKLREVEISVRDFGAVGNGVANDTPAFQAVYAYAIALGGPIRCRVPAGSYLLSTSPVAGAGKVIWKIDDGVTFSGAGNLPYFTPTKWTGRHVGTGWKSDVVGGAVDRVVSPLVDQDAVVMYTTNDFNTAGGNVLAGDAVLVLIKAVQNAAHKRAWAQNTFIVKTSAAAGNYSCGLEVSVQNQTSEALLPNAAGCLMGVFSSYIESGSGADFGSAAFAVGGTGASATKGWLHGLWIDNIANGGYGIAVRNSAGNTMTAGIDISSFTGTFGNGAITLGNNHEIKAKDNGGTLRNIATLDASNYLQLGVASLGMVLNTNLLAVAGVTTTTSAPAAGGAGALPATPAGYMSVSINGTARKIPYYT